MDICFIKKISAILFQKNPMTLFFYLFSLFFFIFSLVNFVTLKKLINNQVKKNNQITFAIEENKKKYAKLLHRHAFLTSCHPIKELSATYLQTKQKNQDFFITTTQLIQILEEKRDNLKKKEESQNLKKKKDSQNS